MTIDPPAELTARCRAILTTLDGAPASEEALTALARDLALRAERRGADADMLRTMAENLLVDGDAVQALLDSSHPAHAEQWLDMHETILRWLHGRGVYPLDDLALDERAPDVATLADLRRALPGFDHACRLDTFLISLVKRRTQQWLRDREAVKRGGEGIFSRARRQQRAAEGVAATRKRDQVRYLSQLLSNDGQQLEDLLGADVDITEVVQQRELLQLVLAEAQAQAAAEGSDALLSVWYAVLVEGHSQRQLAATHGLSPGEMSAMLRRFRTRLQTALASWLDDSI